MKRQAGRPKAATEVPRPIGAIKVRIGSLTWRIIGVAAVWIAVLLVLGGFALDRVLSRTLKDNFDQQLVLVLNSLITSSEVGPDGEVHQSRQLADERIIQP